MADLMDTNAWGKLYVPEPEFRRLIMERDSFLTSSQLDFLLSLVEKTSEGEVIVGVKNAPVQKNLIPLDDTHYEFICRRIVLKLRNAGVEHGMVGLTNILQNFWSIQEWNRCFSEYLPFYLSNEEAGGLLLRLLESG